MTKTFIRSLWVGAVSAAVSGTLFYFLWAEPSARRLNEARAETSFISNRLTGLVRQNPELVTLQKKLNEERATFAKSKENWIKLSSGVRTEDEMMKLLGGQWLSGTAGFSPPLVMPTSRAENAFSAKSIYDVTVEGSYARITEYLDAIERSWPYARVLSARITRSDGLGAWREKLECQIEVFTLRPSRPAGMASPDADLSPKKTETLRTPFGLFKSLGAEQTSSKGLPKISSILFRGKGRYILADGKAFREGEKLPGNFLVKEITSDRAILSNGGLDTVLVSSST